MVLRVHQFLLFIFLLFPALGHTAECAKGLKTSLESIRIHVPSTLRHEQSNGQTEFILRSQQNGKKLFSKEYDGNWLCIGFNEETSTYVIGGISEHGAWLPLSSIQYLREDGSAFTPSAFDRLGYLAMSGMLSPSGRYLAFIGYFPGKFATAKLYVLEVKRDVVKELGPAPAPPPDSFGVCDKSEKFEWGTCWGDSYVEMEADVLHFKSENLLEVSYGSDGPQARAKKRQIRLFKL